MSRPELSQPVQTYRGAEPGEPLIYQDPEILLEVRGLKPHFPVRKGFLQRTVGHVRAVDDVSFFVRAGETLGLVGESGCGKTTVGRAIGRIYRPTAGEVLFRSSSLGRVADVATLGREELKAIRREIQIIYQDPFSSLNPRMRVGEILEEPLIIHGIGTKKERQQRIDSLLDAVGLRPAYKERFPHEFSGGQRQRIGIARALALQPKLVIADEPVSALDVSVQSQILNLLHDLQEEFGLTYVFVAHDLSVIGQISDRVAVMYLGQVVELADLDALYYSPRHPYTEALLSAVPRPDPDHQVDRILLEGTVPSPIDPPTGCRFHTRCSHAKDPSRQGRCQSVVPELHEVAPGHWAACHFSAELLLRTIDGHLRNGKAEPGPGMAGGGGGEATPGSGF